MDVKRIKYFLKNLIQMCITVSVDIFKVFRVNKVFGEFGDLFCFGCLGLLGYFGWGFFLAFFFLCLFGFLISQLT